MFRRRSSQRPSDALVSDFRKSFPDVMQNTSHQPVSSPLEAPALDAHPSFLDLSNFQDNHKPGSTPALTLDHLSTEWRAPFMDANMNFEHHMADFGAFFPPTPNNVGQYAPSHKNMAAAADVSNALGMDTPVSTSTTAAPFFHSRSQSLSVPDSGFAVGPGSLQHATTFPQQAPGGFPPHAFEHAQTMHGAHSFLPDLKTRGIDHASLLMHDPTHVSSVWDAQPDSDVTHFSLPPEDSDDSDSFRFRTTLKATTAMIKHDDEQPVAYLNKSQLYEITIVDRRPAQPYPYQPVRYRTAIRIAFDDSQMRRRPEQFWGLWQEGRGKDEAYKRGGRLQAVEFAFPEGERDPGRAASTQLVTECFDGFSVEWTPTPGKTAERTLHVRFNFLSTDFSHSKGVKGAAVRLCSKTEILGPHQTSDPSLPNREICYCNVKTFRDHGAERKMANDKAHVQKLITRIGAQIEQAEAEEEQNGPKRKRRESYVAGRPSKYARTRRSSQSSRSSDDNQDVGTEDLRKKLQRYERMPYSSRTELCLSLRGEEQDDLDTHPIPLQGQSPSTQLRGSFQPPALKRDSTQTDSMSTLKPGNLHRSSTYPTPPHLTSQSSSGTQPPSNRLSSHGESTGDAQQLASPSSTSSTRQSRAPTSRPDGPVPSIEVKDVDPSYTAPSTPRSKPVACLYVKPSISGKRVEDDDYRAIYLKQRTLAEFISALTMKCGLEPNVVVSTVRVNERGLQIRVEDDMIEALPEGQDLMAEFNAIELTHDTAEQFYKAEEEGLGASTPPITYNLTLRY